MIPDICLHGGGLKLVADEPATERREVTSATLYGLGVEPYRGNRVSRNDVGLTVTLDDAVLRDLPADAALLRDPPQASAIRSHVMLGNYARLAAPETETRDDLIAALAEAMAHAQRPDWPQGVERIPSIFVYFGQFLAHDVSRLYAASTGKVINLNSAMLDLNTVFWSQRSPPADLQSVYAQAGAEWEGEVGVGPTSAYYRKYADLPRRPDGTALMPDCRSDANVFLAQLHVALNRRYIRLRRSGNSDAERTMRDEIHDITLFDFLPRIVDKETWDDVMTKGRRIVRPGADPVTDFEVPIEFAAAAFRFGHAMVQDEYLWSRTGNGRKPVKRLLDNTKAGGSLVKVDPDHHVLVYDWPATWADSDRPNAPNVAEPIAPAIAPDLTRLEKGHVVGATGQSNLALLTLLRGQQVELPSAQALWAAHSASLPGAHLSPTEIADQPPDLARVLTTPSPDGTLSERTPLWFYVLREAQHVHCGARLGPLAGRIVMETLHAAVMAGRAGEPPAQSGMTLARLLTEDLQAQGER